MAKKEIKIDADVQKLVSFYLKSSDQDFNQLLNEALKSYIISQLDSKQVKKVLQAKDDDSSELGRLLQNSFGWLQD